jgi:hypothetical protein
MADLLLPCALPLPPNATQMERSLAVALALPDDLLNLSTSLESRFEEPDDEDLPFLIWEWGLQPVLPFLDNPRRALKEGRKWQKTRGTIPAGHTARSWLDIVAEHEQQQDKRFHLHLSKLISGTDLEGTITLSRLSHSMRSHLYRLTYGLDHRATKRGGKSRKASSIRARSSGVRVRDDWPLLSFREFETSKTDLQSTVKGYSNADLRTVAVRQTDIRRGHTIKPGKLSMGPLVDIALSDNVSDLTLGVKVIESQERDLFRAAIYGGKTKRNDFQSVHAAYNTIKGTHSKRSSLRNEGYTAPKLERLTALIEPYSNVTTAFLQSKATSEVSAPVDMVVTNRQRPIKALSKRKKAMPFDIGISTNTIAIGDQTRRDISQTQSLKTISGVLRGTTRKASFQAIKFPTKLKKGKHGKRAISKRTDHILPILFRLTKIKAPISISAYADNQAHTSSTLSFSTLATVTGVSQAPLDKLTLELSDFVDLNNAPYSALPPSNEPYGTSPRALLVIGES